MFFFSQDLDFRQLKCHNNCLQVRFDFSYIIKYSDVLANAPLNLNLKILMSMQSQIQGSVIIKTLDAIVF